MEEVDAKNLRARLLGLIFEDLLTSGLKICGYNSIGKDVRRGFYGVAADFYFRKERDSKCC